MSEQTMTETPDTEQPNAPVENEISASDELDALLDSYKPEEPAPPATPEPTAPAVNPDTIAQFEQFMAKQQATEAKTALAETAQLMKKEAGEVASGLPDDVFEGQLHLEASRNPKIGELFNNREKDPEAWNKISATLGKKIAEKLNPPDKHTTESWAAVDSALHNSSTSAPKQETTVDSKTLSGMSDQEFAAMQKQMGFKR